MIGAWSRPIPGAVPAILLLLCAAACGWSDTPVAAPPGTAAAPPAEAETARLAAGTGPADPPPAVTLPAAVPGEAGAPAPAAAPAPRRISIDTNLVVDEDVKLMARTSGIVEAILADRGGRVKKGDPLLKLMNHDRELVLQRAEVEARQRRADFERARRLFEERTISASQFEGIQLDLEAAEVEVEIAREEIEKTIVRAPFDGLIVDRFVRIGQRVVEDDDVPLFRLTTLSPLQARLYLPEEVSRFLRQGDRAEVVPRYAAAAPVTGTIRWISRVVDAGSGTCQAIVAVPGGGAGDGLTPGASVTVVLDLPGTPPRPRSGPRP